MDADTKLVPCVMLGGRNGAAAHDFISDLASRLRYRVQLTSDGHRPYLDAVESAFGGQIDYAMLVKLYGPDAEGERRYSPPVCLGAIPTVVTGNPDPDHISTSFVAAVAINYFAYNFCKIHSTLRVSPAMAAGVMDRLFDVSDLVALLIESEGKKAA